MAGRIATIILFILSSSLVFVLDTAKGAFDVILQVGAGTGLLYLVRWFWWRVNAWCEVVAMMSSFLVSLIFLILEKEQIYSTTSAKRLIMTVLMTTICWLLAAYIAPQTERQTLIDFYRKVKPAGPGWAPVRQMAGMTASEAAARGDSIPLALVGWVSGCALIWSSLFTVGSFLYGRIMQGVVLMTVFMISGLILLLVVSRLWKGTPDYEVETQV
jgi:hypothetical protein